CSGLYLWFGMTGLPPQVDSLSFHLVQKTPGRSEVKTILNRIQPFVGFVYQAVRLRGGRAERTGIEIVLAAHGAMRGRCAQCGKPSPDPTMRLQLDLDPLRPALPRTHTHF